MGQLENSDTDEFSIVKPDESFSPQRHHVTGPGGKNALYLYNISHLCKQQNKEK